MLKPLVQCKQGAEDCASSLLYSEQACPRLGHTSYMGILNREAWTRGQEHLLRQNF